MDAANGLLGPCGNNEREAQRTLSHITCAPSTEDNIAHISSPPSSVSAEGVAVDGNKPKRSRHRRCNMKHIAASASLLFIAALSSRTVLLSIKMEVHTSNGSIDKIGGQERESYDPLAWALLSSYGLNLRDASSMATRNVADGDNSSGGRSSAARKRMEEWDHVFLPAVPAPGTWPIEGHKRHLGVGNLTISTLVPSLVGDSRNGNLARLVLSMRSQTIPADEVVIVTSDVDGDSERLRSFPDGGAGFCSDLHSKLRTVLGNRPPLRLVCVGERLTAGRARNVAAWLSGGQVLSFVDADDRELPPRNEVIKNLLACYPELKMVVHSYTSSDPSNHKYDVSRRGKNDTALLLGGGADCADKEEGLEVVRGAALYDILRKTYKRWWIRGDLAHGHVVVRREVWDNEVRFTSLAKGEDSAFVRDVLFTYGRDDGASVFINRPLTSYDKSNKANKDILKF